MLRPIVEVLEAYGLFALRIDEVGSGIINQTWKLELDDERTLVLQKVNPVFPPSVNDEIHQLTVHLKQKGLLTPELIPNLKGSFTTEYADDNWRLMTYVPGKSYDGLETPEQAYEAGAALARFHTAVADLDIVISNQRPHVHDTVRHIQNLCDALEEHADHTRFAHIVPLAGTILSSAAALPAINLDAVRLVHGDPRFLICCLTMRVSRCVGSIWIRWRICRWHWKWAMPSAVGATRKARMLRRGSSRLSILLLQRMVTQSMRAISWKLSNGVLF